MDWKNQLTRTPYLVLFIVLISVGVGTASALITITLAGDVIITGDMDVQGGITGPTVDNLQNQINSLEVQSIPIATQNQIDNIEGNVTSSTFGLEEIKNEVRFIEGNVTSSTFGLEEIKTEVTAIESTQYIPFSEKITPAISGEICDVQGDTLDIDSIIINSTSSSGDFIVTSLVILPQGVDESEDRINITLLIDEKLTNLVSIEITGTTSGSFGTEILGIDTLANLRFPLQIAANSAGNEDIKLTLTCDASTSTDLKISTVFVSGWKKVNETISITYVE